MAVSILPRARARRSAGPRRLLAACIPAKDGAVFLNVERGVIFKSNRVGSRIWQGVLNQESLAAMAAQISREYAVSQKQVAQDAAQFLAQLEAEGFLARNVGE